MNIPKHWVKIPLQKLVINQKGKKPTKLSAQRFAESVPYLDIEAIEKNVITRFSDAYTTALVTMRDIIVVKDGSRSGLVAKGIDGALGSTLMCLTPIGINRDFLYYFLTFNYRYFNENTTGSSIPHLNTELFFNIDVPVPPIEEQKRIATAIAERIVGYEKDFADAEKAIENVNTYKKGILEQAFSGKLSENWRKNNPQSSSVWKEMPLGELFDIGSGLTPSRGNTSYWQKGTIPWIKSGEVNSMKISSASECITQLAIEETGIKIFPKKTILIAMYGEGKTRGQVGILGINASVNQAVAALVPKVLDETLIEYTYYFIKSQYYKLRSFAEGSAQANLSVGIVRSLLMPIPSSSEQAELNRLLREFFRDENDTEEEHRRNLDAINRLKQALLQLAFSGELAKRSDKDTPVQLQLIEQERHRLEQSFKASRKAKLELIKKLNMKLDAKQLKHLLTEHFADHAFSTEELLAKVNIDNGDYDQFKDLLFSLLQEPVNESEDAAFLQSVYDKTHNKPLLKIKNLNETLTT